MGKNKDQKSDKPAEITLEEKVELLVEAITTEEGLSAEMVEKLVRAAVDGIAIDPEQAADLVRDWFGVVDEDPPEIMVPMLVSELKELTQSECKEFERINGFEVLLQGLVLDIESNPDVHGPSFNESTRYMELMFIYMRRAITFNSLGR